MRRNQVTAKENKNEFRVFEKKQGLWLSPTVGRDVMGHEMRELGQIT